MGQEKDEAAERPSASQRVLRKQLDDPSQAYRAYWELERLGREGAEYGDVLISHLITNKGDSSLQRAAVAVLQHDNSLIQKLIARFWELPSPFPYQNMISSVMADLGPRCAALDPALVPRLLAATYSEDLSLVAHANIALGGVTRGTEVAVSRLIELTAHSRDIVQGTAISALGEIRACPDIVVLHLANLLDTFEEYDCDMGYHGAYTRIAEALAEFGGEAARVLPQIMAHLLAPPQLRELDNSILGLLARLGTSARSALPVLEDWRRKVDQDPRHGDIEALDEAIAAIRGDGSNDSQVKVRDMES